MWLRDVEQLSFSVRFSWIGVIAAQLLILTVSWSVAQQPVHPVRTIAADRAETSAPARSILLSAEESLRRGRISEARASLESLVTAFPNADEALRARRLLGAIGGTQEGATPQQAWPVQIERQRAEASEAASTGVRLPSDRSSSTVAFSDSVADRVFFPPSSAVLGARALAVITNQAAWIKARSSVSVIVEGHADDPGGDAANEAIAHERAVAVRQRLIEAGVPDGRIEVRAAGARLAIAPCGEAECAAQNRRVLTVVEPGLPRQSRAASARD